MMDNKQNNKNKFYKNQNFYVALIVALCLIVATVVVVVRNGANNRVTDAPINPTIDQSFDNRDKPKVTVEEEGVGTVIEGEEEDLQSTEDNGVVIVEEDKTIEETEEAIATSTNILKDLKNPVEGTIVYPFRNGDKGVLDKTDNINKTPRGIGIKSEIGTEVKAAADGVVEVVKFEGKYGETIVIKHTDNLRTIYANLDEKVSVKVGDKVKVGDVIGKIGKSASNFAKEEPHLHFEVLEADVDYEVVMKNYNQYFDSFVDPAKYLSLK